MTQTDFDVRASVFSLCVEHVLISLTEMCPKSQTLCWTSLNAVLGPVLDQCKHDGPVQMQCWTNVHKHHVGPV